jgi:hypothetical protein
MLNSAKERTICDGLVAISPSESDTSLREESIVLIMSIIGCSDDQAMEVLDDLCGREVIAVELFPPGGELNGGQIPISRYRWTRPAARI